MLKIFKSQIYIFKFNVTKIGVEFSAFLAVRESWDSKVGQNLKDELVTSLFEHRNLLGLRLKGSRWKS